jgi:hypothetical protein
MNGFSKKGQHGGTLSTVQLGRAIVGDVGDRRSLRASASRHSVSAQIGAHPRTRKRGERDVSWPAQAPCRCLKGSFQTIRTNERDCKLNEV